MFKEIQNQIGHSCALLVSQIHAWTAPIPGNLVYSRDDWDDGMLDGQIKISLKL